MEQTLVENISSSERVALDNFIFNESFLGQRGIKTGFHELYNNSERPFQLYTKEKLTKAKLVAIQAFIKGALALLRSVRR